jgi:Protein of unknown function (DUF3592)
MSALADRTMACLAKQREARTVVVFGAVFTVIGLATLARVCWIRQTGVRVQGAVVGSEGVRSASSTRGEWSTGTGMIWRPVVQFTPVDGDAVEFCSRIATPFRYKPGQPVPVCYRASRPQSAVIDTFSQAWLIPVAFLVFGIVGLATAF